MDIQFYLAEDAFFDIDAMLILPKNQASESIFLTTGAENKLQIEAIQNSIKADWN